MLTHESSRVGDISADFAVDLDEPLHADLFHFIPCQGVLQAVPQEDDEGQALPQLVGTGGGTRSLRWWGQMCIKVTEPLYFQKPPHLKLILVKAKTYIDWIPTMFNTCIATAQWIKGQPVKNKSYQFVAVIVLTKTPVSLSSIQCFGAATRFRCFFGPRAWREERTQPVNRLTYRLEWQLYH